MDWSYIAGYFDGEGHVGLHAHGTRPNSKVVSLTWYNSDKQSLDDMQAFMGVGRVVLGSQSGLGTKPMYELVISSKLHMLYALDNMLPTLRIKKKPAEELRQHLLDNVDETRAKNYGVLLAIPESRYRQLYEEEGKSLAEIAAIFDATPSGILRIFRVYGIERRGNPGMRKGMPKSPETRARMKASRSKLWEDPTFRAQQLQNLSKGPQGKRSKGYTKPAIQGEKHPRSKLTDVQTAEIYARYQAGQASLQSLATEYGVSKKTILNIVQGKIRTHVTAALAPAPSLEEGAVTDERC